MITAQENFGDAMAEVFRRTGVLRKLQHAIAARERILPTALFISKDTRDHADGRIDDNHRGDFPTIENEVADTQFQRPEYFDDSMVEALVATAQQDQSTVRSELFNAMLTQSLPLRCQKNDKAGDRVHGPNIMDTLDHGFDTDEHARTATVGTIIYLVMLGIDRPVAKVMDLDFDEPAIDRLSQ